MWFKIYSIDHPAALKERLEKKNTRHILLNFKALSMMFIIVHDFH